MALVRNQAVQQMPAEEKVAGVVDVVETGVVEDPGMTRAFSPEEVEYIKHAAGTVVDDTVSSEMATREWTEQTTAIAEASGANTMQTYQAGTVVAMSGGYQRQTLEQEAAAAGFEGAELNFNSFPMIALQTDGLFSDTEGRPFNKEFACRVLETKSKVVYRGLTSGRVEDTKKDIVYVYPNRNHATGVYEEVVTSKGLPIKDALNELTARGLELDRSEYIDIKVMMYAPEEEYHDEIFLLSIPPTSKGRFWGQYDTIVKRKRWTPQQVAENLCNYLMTVRCGEKVMKAKTPFYPWAFRFATEESPL